MNEITVIVRLPYTREEIEVTFPEDATSRDVIEALLESSDVHIKRYDEQEQEIVYNLNPKGKNSALLEGQTLSEAGVQDGDILLLTPTVVAGK